MLDAQQIQDIIPHRYPFLLVDRILEVDGEKRAVGIKNVTVNEEFFNGHFPGYPVMPGVLIVEALAQVFGVIMLGKEENKGKIGLFAGIGVPGKIAALRYQINISRRPKFSILRACYKYVASNLLLPFLNRLNFLSHNHDGGDPSRTIEGF